MSADWPVVNLSELVDELTVGFVGSMTKEYVNEGIPFLRSKNIVPYNVNWDDIRYISENFHKKLSKSILHPGDVAIVRTGKPGTACVIPESITEANCSDVVIARVNDEKLNAHYLAFFMNSIATHQVNSHLVGAVQQHFNVGSAKQLKIPLPSRKEQENIVTILKNLNDKIKLNHQISQTLEEMARAIFKSWFVDFEPVKAKIEAKANGQDPERAAMCVISGKNDTKLDRLSSDQLTQLRVTAALFPDELVESELGLIPKEWEVRNVSNIVKRLKPKKRYTKKQVVKYGSVPVFEQGAAILLGYHNDDPGFNATAEKPLFIFGDHTCVCYLSCTPFDISQNVIPLSGVDLPTLWVYYAVKDKQKFQEYRRHWSELIIKKVIEPNIELCQFFSETVTILYQKKEHSVEENNTLSQLRDTLLPKLLSGEIELGQGA